VKKRQKVANTSSTSAIPQKNRTILSAATDMSCHESALCTDTLAVAGTDGGTAKCVDSTGDTVASPWFLPATGKNILFKEMCA